MTINDLLIEKGFTVYKLSKISGIPKTTLFDIFSGKRNILECRLRVVLKLSDALGISINDLVSLDPVLYNEAYEKNLPEFLLKDRLFFLPEILHTARKSAFPASYPGCQAASQAHADVPFPPCQGADIQDHFRSTSPRLLQDFLTASPILLPDVPTRSCSSDCIFGKQKRIPGRVVHKYTPFLPQAALSLFAALRYP